MEKIDKRNGFIDIAKFVMSIGIMLGHYQYIMAEEFESVHIDRLLLRIANKSLTEIVCVFFVISGFFAYNGFKKLHAAGVSEMGPFLKKKINRLYPLMILSIIYFCLADIAYAIVHGHFWAGRSVNAQNIIFACLGITKWVCDDKSINGPIWYVSVLMLCFVIFCLVSTLNIRVEYKYMIFGLLIILGLISQLHNEITFPLIAEKVGRGYMCFFTGVITSSLFEKKPEIASMRNVVICALLFVLLCVFGYKTGNSVIGETIIVTALYLSPMMIAFSIQKPIKRVFNNKLSSWLGAVSYGIFLLHIPTYVMASLLFGNSLDYNSWLVICIIIAVVVGLSGILSMFIDKRKII